jgi:ribosomal protein S18 acetylase RimI-like enzyme
MELRAATLRDAGAIAIVHVASTRQAYRGLFPASALSGIDTDDRAERWRQTLTDPSGTTLVVEADGQILGFVHYGPCRDEDVAAGRVGEIMSIYVAPDSWGQGAGQTLLQASLERLAAAGFREVKLWAIDRNARADAFYTRAGFVRDGMVRHREMFRVPITVVRYHASLSGT